MAAILRRVSDYYGNCGPLLASSSNGQSRLESGVTDALIADPSLASRNFRFIDLAPRRPEDKNINGTYAAAIHSHGLNFAVLASFVVNRMGHFSSTYSFVLLHDCLKPLQPVQYALAPGEYAYTDGSCGKKALWDGRAKLNFQVNVLTPDMFEPWFSMGEGILESALLSAQVVDRLANWRHGINDNDREQVDLVLGSKWQA